MDKPEIGEVRFEVEWCTHFAIDANGEQEMNRHQWGRRYFTTRDAAQKFAKSCKPEGFGVVQIIESVAVEVDGVRGCIGWDDVGEVEEIDVPFKEPATRALDTARTIASALGQPKDHPGTARLAGDLAGGGQ